MDGGIISAVAVVTGGARGIGASAARTLAAGGHPVCVNDTGVDLAGDHPSPAPADALVAEIVAAGGQAMATAVDARSRAGAVELVAAVEAWAGTAPTVLVHAAGTLRDGMIHKTSDEDWAEVLGSHLGVAVELTRAMLPGVRAAGYGRVVYVGGAAGLVGSVGQGAYDVAKAGLFGLTRATALELARHDACVNYLVPFAFTRMTESIPPATDQLRRYLEWAPLVGPDDVAEVIGWLCSPAAAGLTGQVVGARGGEVTLWSQPRPVAEVSQPTGWDLAGLTDRVRSSFEPHLTPLESEFDLFAGPPAVLEPGVRS